MSWVALTVDGVMSALLLVMIAYCVRLNRALGGLRERDAEIEGLILRFREASDRAEASVASLKAAGIEAEGMVRAASERARAVRDELAALIGRRGREPFRDDAVRRRVPMPLADAGAAGPGGQSGGVFPPELFEPDSAAIAGAHAPREPDPERSAAEQALLRAIRSARAGG